MNEEVRAPDKEKIRKDYLSGIKPKELSDKYDVSINTLKSWIKRYGWSKNVTKEGAPRKHKGAPLNNTNAVGHGAPVENKNAERHGFFSKWLPEETMEIMQSIQHADPLDLLWDNIQLQYTAIVRAQQIMFVKSKEDLTKELKRQKESVGETSESWEKEYELQFAWDKHATFLKAQSRAMGELRSMIKQYDEMLHNNWEKASEEQKLRISKLRYEVSQLSGGNEGDTGIKDFLKAVKPTPEDIKAMFTDEEAEVTEDAEEDKAE
jgi:uncharacterized protein YjcR